jgi:hypothetical protein
VCLADALQAQNPSPRQALLDAARTWAKTAELIERHVIDGRGEVYPDLRHKLN